MQYKFLGGMAVKELYSVLCNAHWPCAFDLEFRSVGSFLTVCMYCRMPMTSCSIFSEVHLYFHVSFYICVSIISALI